MTRRQGQKSGAAAPRGRRPPSSGNEGLHQIAMRLPRAVLRILETEAGTFGWARSQFLDALVWHKLGQGVRLERLPAAPRNYRFSEKDWIQTERWIWYLSGETKRRLDELRMRMGNIKPSAWVSSVLTEWAGTGR
jgi:hypothetical protein